MSSAIQHAMSQKFIDASFLTVTFAFPAKCGIQREPKIKKINIQYPRYESNIYFKKKTNFLRFKFTTTRNSYLLLKATIVTHSLPATGVIRFIIRTHFQEHLKTSSKCCIITVKYLIFKICIFFIL